MQLSSVSLEDLFKENLSSDRGKIAGKLMEDKDVMITKMRANSCWTYLDVTKDERTSWIKDEEHTTDGGTHLIL